MKKNKILPNENVNTAIRVSTITLIINLILSLLKFIRIYRKPSAMLSDAVHWLDVLKRRCDGWN
ncbi:MAG: hypothetical protein ACLS8D_13330 [Clostridioides difficile]